MSMNNGRWKRNWAAPFFSRRGNKYVWRRRDNNNILPDGTSVPMADKSCTITSLCMIMNYLELTDETPEQMMKNAFETCSQWSQESTAGTKGANRLQARENLRTIITDRLVQEPATSPAEFAAIGGKFQYF
jgi:hypothetical protein